ncbi:MAG: DPP IV N-terminal domain-containing protein [Anaerolineae bacterium]|nr:DPP IV N-terminal domain-containing protein [Anaerolineae bacterium]
MLRHVWLRLNLAAALIVVAAFSILLTPAASIAQQDPTPTFGFEMPTIAPPPTRPPLPTPAPINLSYALGFISERDGPANLYIMDTNGTIRRVTDESLPHWYPDWSPDGSTIIAHAHQSAAVWSIYAFDADGANMHLLTDEPTRDAAPEWSPDGTAIVFTRDEEIWLMQPDGRDQYPLVDDPTALPGAVSGTAWSPDATRIAFSCDIGGNYELFVINVDGTGLEQLTFTDRDEWWFDWSPDGTQIAVMSAREGNFDIWIIDADPHAADRVAPRKLTDDAGEDWEPAWSPDGAQIAFHSNRDGNQELYVINVDGTGLQRLTFDYARDLSPVWLLPSQVGE